MVVRIPQLLLLSSLIANAAPRVANETIVMPETPPVTTIELENAFSGLTFSQPVCLRSPEGDTQRLFVCEKTGDLELIPDVTATSPTKTIFLNVDSILSGRGESIRTNSEQGLLGVAFHPAYATNGFFFTVYNVRVGGLDYQRLSRWHDPNIDDTSADPNSEDVLIEMRNNAGNHNGGDLHFGPDGYLYMSWGDEGNANDSLNNSQFLDEDFWAGLTRIDVDLEPEDYTAADGTGSDDANVRPNAHPAVKLVGGNPLYEVPADNPWVGATSFNGVTIAAGDVRTEFYAVGLRNPWRFSFDSETGELWLADVGQGAREEVSIIENGSNHGWAWYEGFIAGPKFNNSINGASRAGATLTPPIWDYPRGNGEFEGTSVTGGFVYRGNNIPDLVGKYIFADYGSGNIWSLERTDTPGSPDVVRIAGEGGIVGFGPDPSNGDVLLADINNGLIRRLVASDNTPGGFPATLTATGVFSNVVSLTPNPGVIPYDVNLPFWSDYALKQRWFAIKNTSDLIGFSEEGPWDTPTGMVFVKHFDLELERGNPVTKKRLETRVLVRNQTGEPQFSTLISDPASCRVLVPSSGAVDSTWTGVGFDDSTWGSAQTGVGYDENTTFNSHFGAGGNLGNALNGVNTTVYVRIPFQVTDAASISALSLRMKYDDGFVAFLNGQRVAEANPPEDDVPAQVLEWNAVSSGNHPDSQATSFVDFDISAFASALQNGTNVLAIHGLNDGINSSDMLIAAELLGGAVNYTQGSYGVSYKWNEAGTEAFLVGSGGEDFDLTVSTPTGPQVQTWNIPSRAACLSCHTPEAGHALSFNTRQLNREGVLEASSGNFLNLLNACEYLDSPPPSPSTLPRHVGPAETDFSLEARVRAYLAVNCAYCHQDPGTDPVTWLGNPQLTIDQTGLINGVVTRGAQHPDDRLIVPGMPVRSVILNRVAAANGYTRMPSLATNELDAANIQLLTDWINQEASDLTTYTAWRIHHFGDAVSAEGEPDFNADGDLINNEGEWLALTDPNDGSDFLQTSITRNDKTITIDLPGTANRSITVEHSLDLFDWFLLDVPGNDGIPRNPASGGSLEGATSSEREYFRLRVEE